MSSIASSSGSVCLQHVRVRVGQFQVRTGQAQATLGELGAEVFGAAQVADRAEIDAGVTGGGHLVQDGVAVRNIRVESDGDLERAVADRRVRDDDSVVACSYSWSF